MEPQLAAPMIGMTNRKLFLPIFGFTQIIVVAMLIGVAQGAVAIAAILPAVGSDKPYTLHVDKLTAGSFKLVPGVSPIDGKTPVLVASITGDIQNQVITTNINGSCLRISAGDAGTPAHVDGVTQDLTQQTAQSATFQNLAISSGGGFSQTAGNTVLTNANIETAFLSGNSTTLPNLKVSVAAC